MVSRTSRPPSTSVRGPIALMLVGVIMMGAATTFAPVAASAVAAGGVIGVSGRAASFADLEPASDTGAAGDETAHHAVTVTFSTLMHRTGDVVTSVLLQGPDPETGRPGWSKCIDLPQSGLPTWTTVPVRLAYAADYTTSSYRDFACAGGFDYRWSAGTISTRFTHWTVYTFRAPRISLR